MQASSDRRRTDPEARPPGAPADADPQAPPPGAPRPGAPRPAAAEARPHGDGTLGMRASDAERDQVVSQLRERFAEGRITQDTFLYRMDAALHAKGRSELLDLLHDLPGAKDQSRATRQTMRGALMGLWRAAASRRA